MKKLIGFGIATVAVLATAIGVQTLVTTGHDDAARQPTAAASPQTPAPAGAKADDGDRAGFTEDHQTKPGESK